MTPPDSRLAAIRLHLQVRQHERMGVPFAKACRLVGAAADVDPFSVRALVVGYRESLGGPPAAGMTASEYAAILSSRELVDAILAAFNMDGSGA